MRWFSLSLLFVFALSQPVVAQNDNKQNDNKQDDEKKERFYGRIRVAKLADYSKGYDKSRIVTVRGKVVGIFSLKPKKDSDKGDWGMAVRLGVGGELPLVYLGTYGKLDAKISPIELGDELTVRGAVIRSRPRRIVADTLWRKDDKVSIRKSEIDSKVRDPYVKGFSWQKTTTIRGTITGTRQLVSMGPYTGVFVRLGISQWAYLGSAEHLHQQKFTPHVTSKLAITGKWVKHNKRSVLIAGKIKSGKKEIEIRDKDGKLLRAGRKGA